MSLVSLRELAKRLSMDTQTLTVLECEGLITPAKIGGSPKARRVFFDLDVVSARLTANPGEILVSCPGCKRKYFEVSQTHYKKCPSGIKSGPVLKSTYYSQRRADVAASNGGKISKALTDRFRTPEGEITKKQISEASSRYNKQEAVVKAKAEAMRARYSRQGERKLQSTRSREVWQRPEVIKARAAYVAENIETLRESALKARASLSTSSSKIHLRCKDYLEKVYPGRFHSELKVGFFEIDEADTERKVAIEIDGCYWHGCEICGLQPPKENKKASDKRKDTYLRNRGWSVYRVKECILYSEGIETTLSNLLRSIYGQN